MRCYTIGPKSLFKIAYSFFIFTLGDFTRIFFFIFNDVEAMIERLENISYFIKALAYCELLIKFRHSEKATKGWPI